MWIFERKSGALAHDEEICGFGYSGHGAGVNNAQLQNVKDVGPIPAGLWVIGEFFDDPRTGDQPHKGLVVAHLTPGAGTETFGRGGFMIHGDNKSMNRTASEGCIILARSLREQIRDSGDCFLKVE